MELTDWLQRRALKNEGAASRTYVCCDETNHVIGYYAIATGAVAHAESPGSIKRNMPDPIPVFVLGRLAVHEKWTGMGVGRGLLKDAVRRCLEAAQHIGSRAIVCHAIDGKAKNFYLRHGFHPSPLEPLTVMLGLRAASTF
jgi:predicted N-acetyltransferase YhbS